MNKPIFNGKLKNEKKSLQKKEMFYKVFKKKRRENQTKKKTTVQQVFIYEVGIWVSKISLTWTFQELW